MSVLCPECRTKSVILMQADDRPWMWCTNCGWEKECSSHILRGLAFALVGAFLLWSLLLWRILT